MRLEFLASMPFRSGFLFRLARSLATCALGGDRRSATNDRFSQPRHFHRRQRGLESLVPHLQASPVDGLLERIAGQYAESVRDTSFLRRLSYAAGAFVNNHVIVRRISAKQASQTNDGIVVPALGQHARSRGNFKTARHSRDLDILRASSGTTQPVERALQEPFGDERVKAAHHNRKPLAGGLQGAFLPRGQSLGLPVNGDDDFSW